MRGALVTGAGAGEGGVPCEEPYSCPGLQTLEKSNLKEIPNVGGTILRKTLTCLECGPRFLPHMNLWGTASPGKTLTQIMIPK